MKQKKSKFIQNMPTNNLENMQMCSANGTYYVTHKYVMQMQ